MRNYYMAIYMHNWLSNITSKYRLDLDPFDRDRDLRDECFEPDLWECDLRDRDLDLDLNSYFQYQLI